jgi:hypothetical protein
MPVAAVAPVADSRVAPAIAAAPWEVLAAVTSAEAFGVAMWVEAFAAAMSVAIVAAIMAAVDTTTVADSMEDMAIRAFTWV